MKFNKYLSTINFSMIILLIIVGLSFAQFVSEKPQQPETKVIKPEKPGPDYFWIDGHWKWDKKAEKYTWQNGNWEKKRKGYKYISGHWERLKEGWHWLPGSWAKMDAGRTTESKYKEVEKTAKAKVQKKTDREAAPVEAASIKKKIKPTPKLTEDDSDVSSEAKPEPVSVKAGEQIEIARGTGEQLKSGKGKNMEVTGKRTDSSQREAVLIKEKDTEQETQKTVKRESKPMVTSEMDIEKQQRYQLEIPSKTGILDKIPEYPPLPDRPLIKPGPDYFYIDGHFEYDKSAKKYIWVNGKWEKSRKGENYIPGEWRKIPKGYIWKPGTWRKIEKDQD